MFKVPVPPGGLGLNAKTCANGACFDSLSQCWAVCQYAQ